MVTCQCAMQTTPATESESTTDWRAWFDEKIGGDFYSFARKRWNYNREVFEQLCQILPQGGRVVECGCGSGVYASYLSLFGFDVTGVDAEPQMVEMAREYAKKLRAPTVAFETADILDMSAHYGKFDVTYSSGVLEHFYHDDAVKVLEEQSRCAPWLLLVVPSSHLWKRKHEEFDGLWLPYTPSSLVELVRKAGYRIEREFCYSAANKVGRAIELAAPEVIRRRIFPPFAATIGVVAKSSRFTPST